MEKLEEISIEILDGEIIGFATEIMSLASEHKFDNHKLFLILGAIVNQMAEDLGVVNCHLDDIKEYNLQ